MPTPDPADEIRRQTLGVAQQGLRAGVHATRHAAEDVLVGAAIGWAWPVLVTVAGFIAVPFAIIWVVVAALIGVGGFLWQWLGYHNPNIGLAVGGGGALAWLIGWPVFSLIVVIILVRWVKHFKIVQWFNSLFGHHLKRHIKRKTLGAIGGGRH